MEFVHRCVVCDWERQAASPTVTSPRCENCGCALESSRATDAIAIPLACILMVCSYAPETRSALPPTIACKALAPPGKSTISIVNPSSLK